MTVIEPKIWRPSATCAMPRWARCDGATASRSRSSKRMQPPLGHTVPEMALNSVVLPAPLGPTMDTNWPARTASEISQSAVKPPYATERDSTASTDRRPFLAEVGLDDALVVDDLARLADCQDGAMVEHDEALGEPHHGAHRMLDDHDGHALRRERTDHREHILDLLASETGERLVHEEKARPSRQRPGELHQPQLLVGEPTRDGVGAPGQPDLRQRCACRRECIRVVCRGRVGTDHDIVEHR